SRARGSEITAWLAMGVALLFVFEFRLVAALIAGLLVYTVLQGTARLLHGRLFSHGTAKVLSAVLVGLIAVSVTAGTVLLLVAVGIVIGLLVFFGHGEPSGRPLASALVDRVKRLQASFQMVVFAQVEISALNTVLTAIYLFGILPLGGHRLPLSGTLLAVTF